MGKLHNELYLLQDSQHCKSFSPVLQSIFKSLVNSFSFSVSKPYLWHMRLGHVSNNKLMALQSIIPNVLHFQSNKDVLFVPLLSKSDFLFHILIICPFLLLI